MAVTAGRVHSGGPLRLHDKFPAEAEAIAGPEACWQIARPQRSHLLQALGLQDALAAELTFVQHHLVQLCEIRPGGVQATRRDGVLSRGMWTLNLSNQPSRQPFNQIRPRTQAGNPQSHPFRSHPK
jgi:hypothetical protein